MLFCNCTRGLIWAIYYLPRRNKNFKAKPSLPKVREKQCFDLASPRVKAVCTVLRCFCVCKEGRWLWLLSGPSSSLLFCSVQSSLISVKLKDFWFLLGEDCVSARTLLSLTCSGSFFPPPEGEVCTCWGNLIIKSLKWASRLCKMAGIW